MFDDNETKDLQTASFDTGSREDLSRDFRFSSEELKLLRRYGIGYPWDPKDLLKLIRRIESMEQLNDGWFLTCCHG